MRRILLWVGIALWVLAVLAALVVLGLEWELNKSEWAAWVQAVGSVGAILVAVGVVQYQHKKETRRAEEAERQVKRRRLTTVLMVIMTTAQTCVNCSHALSKPDKSPTDWYITRRYVEGAIRLLASVPVLEVPDAWLVTRLFSIANNLELLSSLLGQRSVNTVSSSLMDALGAALDRVAHECRVGMTETITLLNDCSTSKEIEGTFQMADAQEAHEKRASEVWANIRKESGPASTV